MTISIKIEIYHFMRKLFGIRTCHSGDSNFRGHVVPPRANFHRLVRKSVTWHPSRVFIRTPFDSRGVAVVNQTRCKLASRPSSLFTVISCLKASMQIISANCFIFTERLLKMLFFSNLFQNILIYTSKTELVS